MTVQQVHLAMQEMTLQELREVNRLNCGLIQKAHAERQQKLLSKFKVGDLVEFINGKGGRTRIRVSRINAKTLSGNEVEGSKSPWRVSPSLCRLVGA